MKLKNVFGMLAVAVMAVAAPAHAAIISFEIGGWQKTFGSLQPGDQVSLMGSAGSIDFSQGPVDAPINLLTFTAGLSDPAATTHSVEVSQLMTITLGGTITEALVQSGTLAIAQADILTLLQGQRTSFVFDGVGTVFVTPLALTLGPNAGGAMYADRMARFEFTPVPEPTTLVAGALLLLPFGASTLRVLRRRRNT